MNDYCFQEKDLIKKPHNYEFPSHKLVKRHFYNVSKYKRESEHSTFSFELDELYLHFNYKYFRAKKIFSELLKKPKFSQKLTTDFINVIFQKLDIKNNIKKLYFLIDSILLDSEIEKKIIETFSSIINKFILIRTDEIIMDLSIKSEDFKKFCSMNLEIKIEDEFRTIEEPEKFFIYSNLEGNSFIISEDDIENISNDLRDSQTSNKVEDYNINLNYKIIDKTKD